MSIQAVIFDCDGVLIDSEAICTRVLVQTLKQDLQIEIAASVLDALVGKTTHEVMTILATQFNFHLTDQQMQDIIHEMRVTINHEKPVLPYVTEVIQALPYPTAVASNSLLADIQRAVEWCQLQEKMNGHLIARDCVKEGKPSPDVYLAAAQSLQVPPHACVAIEDSVVGATAAKRAGMNVIGFTGGSHSSQTTREALIANGVCHFLADMRNLPALLLHIEQQCSIS